MSRRGRTLALLFLCVLVKTQAQVEVGCYSSGECLSSPVLDDLEPGLARDPVDCLEACQEEPDCLYFTYYTEAQECLLLANCEDFSSDGCQDCVSGEASCNTEICSVSGLRCVGASVLNRTEGVVSSEAECLDHCQFTGTCHWYAYDEGDSSCELTSDCPSTTSDDCPGCVLGSVDCGDLDDDDTDDTPDVLTMFVAGGASDYDDMELVRLPSSSSTSDPLSCSKPSDLDTANGEGPGSGTVALLDEQDHPMVCGGFTQRDWNDCFIYDKIADGWRKGPDMNEGRYYPALAKLADGRWFLAGGGYDITATGSTEYFDRGAFYYGPVLPVGMAHPCAVEVSPGVVFLMNNADAFLLDVADGRWTRIADPPESRAFFACGAAPAPDGASTDVLLIGNNISDDVVHVYNTGTGQWSLGPRFPRRITSPTALQTGDGFVVVGGYDVGINDVVPDIYEYDRDNAAWILREERLVTPREAAGLVIVDEDMVNCA